ncbi:hypothetical protein ACP70R_022575 [Stipagrostis hirtigluma subsp. patula]
MPSSTAPPRRRRRRRQRRSKNDRPRRERRDWSELPLDAISYVLSKLDVAELLAGGAAGVCRSWRCAAREDPALWRHVDMRAFYTPAYRRRARPAAVARAAVRFGAGQCDAFWGMYDVDDDFLLFLSEQAPLLKSLRLGRCHLISNQGLSIAIEKFPLLEELELELCQGVGGKLVFEHVSQACPQLKHFGHTKESYRKRWTRSGNSDYGEALAIAGMQELRSLQLFCIDLTNEGLAAILDNCRHLEYLDIRNCSNISMDDTLRAKCARIKIKKLRTYESADECEEFEPGSPISYCSTCCCMGFGNDRANEFSDIEDDHEAYTDSSYYDLSLSEADEIDLDEHDRMVDKSMRRYL